MKNYDNIQSFDELINLEYGEIGTESRNAYEEDVQKFILKNPPALPSFIICNNVTPLFLF